MTGHLQGDLKGGTLGLRLGDKGSLDERVWHSVVDGFLEPIQELSFQGGKGSHAALDPGGLPCDSGLGESFTLHFKETLNGLPTGVENGIELLSAERLSFGCPLDFDETAGGCHDEVEVGFGGAVFGVVEVGVDLAVDDPHPYGRDLMLKGDVL